MTGHRCIALKKGARFLELSLRIDVRVLLPGLPAMLLAGVGSYRDTAAFVQYFVR